MTSTFTRTMVARTRSGTGGDVGANYSHAVCRSTELLSCARTALKIAKSRNAGTPAASTPNAWWTVDPATLHLCNTDTTNSSGQSYEVLEDGLSLLRTMDVELKQLESLVRRRGQTNDPTEEITLSVDRLQADAQELTALIQTMVPTGIRGGGQRQKHWQILQQWFQATAQHQSKRLQEILKVRGTVLAEQARRRKRFQATPASPSALAQKKVTALNSPLFQMPEPRALAGKNSNGSVLPAPGQPDTTATGTDSTMTEHTDPNSTDLPSSAATSQRPAITPTNSRSSAVSSSTNGSNPYTYYSGATSAPSSIGRYGAGYGGNSSGYTGGGYGGGTGTGMRQRRPAGAMQQQQPDTSKPQLQQPDDLQVQLQQRQQERQTAQRREEARQVEKSLFELGTLFGKMSTLISQQGEVLEKVEDDVEAAFVDVTAGHQEIMTLHAIKKGNRGLIIKVFALLIFFIIFMRLYKK